MKNPLTKRLKRELKHDFGKYFVIFAFLILLICLVSGFLVADHSVFYAYEEGFEKYKLEWGHFRFNEEPDKELLENIEKKGEVSLYPLHYMEEEAKEQEATIRVYKDREEVNTECLMEGAMPAADDEIALDRMFAKNAELMVGDTITLNQKTLTITGFIAVPDYSCLFMNNNDMMFDSVHFSVAIMTEQGFNALESTNRFYNYAWKYNHVPVNDQEEKERSDDFIEVIKDEVKAYDEMLVEEWMKNPTEEEPTIVTVDDYLPRYSNQAINFTGEDMGSDKAMFLLFDYIVVIILAFVFAVTTSNTIAAEAGVIGTLRASGYTRRELVRHYMILPVVVTILAAIIGNILGYTVIKDYMVEVYYNSYSLCTYETLWNAEAFIDTTVIPVILMTVINYFVLTKKMRLTPLQFLRKELSKKQQKKPVRLNTKIPFIHRFRIRILLQNVSNYITLFVGIVFAALILIFGLMFTPLLEDYAVLVSESKIANYQYVLKNQVEIEEVSAEKYCVTSLKSLPGEYLEDEFMVYGIESDSKYVTAAIPKGKVLVSNGVMKKFSLQEGDRLTLKAPFGDDTYEFTIAGEYTYDAALAVFMDRADYLEMFDKKDDYFTGYFTNVELKELEDKDIASVITEEDLTKVSTQLLVSMGDFMLLFRYFGVIMFLLMMYLLSKQIIEKNAQSISMVKILGFTNGEIGGLYIIATSVVVVLSLFCAVPLVRCILRYLFSSFLYKRMTGYVPFIISNQNYLQMILMGIISYALVAVLQMIKINKIPKSIALKNVE